MKVRAELPGWDGTLRADGVLLMQTFEGVWVILPRDERPAVDECPCCRRAFREQLDAKHAADYALPLRKLGPPP